MKKIQIFLALILAASLAACGTPEKSAQKDSKKDDKENTSTHEYGKGQTVYVEAARLNMRDRGDREGKQVRMLEQGTQLTILERGRQDTINELTNYWYRVNAGNETGWVFGAHVTVVADNKTTLTLSDGAVYVGQVKDGKPHGRGRSTLDEGYSDIIYEGQWQNGKYHGQGRLAWNGGSQEGQWQNGKLHGQGTEWDHSIGYVGQWQNGKKHGQGREYNDDRLIRKGTWRNDVFIGE